MQPSKPNSQPLKKVELSEGLKKRLAKKQLADSTKISITDEDLIIAEMGILYGYDMMKAIIKDEIDMDTMLIFLQAGRKIKAKQEYNLAVCVLAATTSANSKNPKTAFDEATKRLLDSTRADNYGE